MKIVYLHGWNSSPNSTKVQALQAHYDVIAPALSNDPKEAYATIDALFSRLEDEDIILVGTSLGGYWANYFANKYSRFALIINPSTNPNKTLGLDVPPAEAYSSGASKIVLLAQDDDVIEYRDAKALFDCYGTTVRVFPTGGHRFHEIDIICDNINELIRDYQRYLTPSTELSPTKPVLYFDMDNVLVDFPSGIARITEEQRQQYAGDLDEVPGIFALMDPMPGAIEAFNELAELFDSYILSTAPWENPSAWSDKLLWVKKHLGKHAYKRLILSHNKHLNAGDFLIDDRLANGVDGFLGEHIHFGQEGFESWEKVTAYLKRIRNADRIEHILNYFLFKQDPMHTGCAENRCYDEYNGQAARISHDLVYKGMSVEQALIEEFEYSFGDCPAEETLAELVSAIETETVNILRI